LENRNDRDEQQNLLKEKRERRKYYPELDDFRELSNLSIKIDENNKNNKLNEESKFALETINLIDDGGSQKVSKTKLKDFEEGEIEDGEIFQNLKYNCKILKDDPLTIEDVLKFNKNNINKVNKLDNLLSSSKKTLYINENNIPNKKIIEANLFTNIIPEKAIESSNPNSKKLSSVICDRLFPPKINNKDNSTSLIKQYNYVINKELEFISSSDDSIDMINENMKMFRITNEKKKKRKIEINNDVPKIINSKTISCNYNIAKHMNLYKIETLYELTKKRINIVFDLDMTLVYAEEVEKIGYYTNKNTDTIYTIRPLINERIMSLKIKLRKFSIEMLKRLSVICDFYVYTHGRTEYANEVLKILKDQSKII
jgi:hypothetical protein